MRISDWSSYVCSSDLRTIADDRGVLTAAAFSAQGRWLATAAHGGAIELSDLAVTGSTRTLRAAGAPARLLAFDAGGGHLAASLLDGRAELFDLQQAAAVPRQFESDQLSPYAFAPHSEGQPIDEYCAVRPWEQQR